MARVSRPLTDAELAKAEKVERARKIKQRLEDAADEHLETMAEAGDPEAREAAARLRAALADGGLEAAGALVGYAAGVVEQPPVEVLVKAAPPPSPLRDRRDDPERKTRAAFTLMDGLWRRWRKTAQREGFPKAFRELAMEMGESGVKFVEAGMFADMNDLIQCVQRCVVQGYGDKTDEEGDNYRSDIETMKAELRGEK